MSPARCVPAVVPVVGVDAVASTAPSSPSRRPLVKVEPKSTARIVMTRLASPVDVERLAQVGDEVVDVLDAHRQADEVGGYLELRAGDGAVRHQPRVLDE